MVSVALALFVESDCKVAVTVTVFGDGKLAGAVKVALLPFGVSVPIAGLRLQLTVITPPFGAVAVNASDALKATVPEAGNTESPDAGVGVGVGEPECPPPPQPIKIRKSPHTHTALKTVMSFTPRIAFR